MKTDVIVIGAGAAGLSISEQFARHGHEVILLEKEELYGRGVSSRSTEVIHAGIYYTTGSLKARLCIRGKELLYEFCRKHKVNHKRTGKLFVAAAKEAAGRLDETERQARSNGITDLERISRSKLQELEPELNGHEAVLSPSSGIFDSHGYMNALYNEGKREGVIFAGASPAESAGHVKDGWEVRVGGREKTSVSSRLVINAAGLYAIALSRKIFPGRDLPELYPTKGNYLRYSARPLTSRIVYPAMVPGVIEERVDMTPDLAGHLRFGPDIDTSTGLEDFSVPDTLKAKMSASIKKYLPGIDLEKIHSDCAGIRPKIYGPGQPVKDFMFSWAPEPGWLDLFGIESPGLTASLAIGEYVYGEVTTKGILR